MRTLGVAIVAVLSVGVLQGVPAQAAPSADPATAEELARQAAAEDAPPVEIPDEPAAPELDTSTDQSDPLPDDEFTRAWEQARQTNRQVELESQTTETMISLVQPDGTVKVESSAGPVRAQVDGDWVDVDTSLHFTDEGVRPTAVTGEITFSDGGADPMAVLGDGDATELSLAWAGKLPTPVLDGSTATYRDVFPQVDLVMTATRLGFEQHLLVKERPATATLAQLRRLEFPMEFDGARVAEGAGGEVQVLDGAGKVVGTAAAPVMWDARNDLRAGGPAAVTEMGLELTAPTTPDADATLVLTPSEAVLIDPATVYPVTIDPTQALGALGDSFVQSNIATTAQGGTTELRAGTYDGPTAARSYLRFDVTPVKNRVVQSATLSLFEFHSWSCTARPVDIRNVGNFDPNTITWNGQPAVGSVVASANVAYGYSTACPDNWVNFNLTSWVAHYADSRNAAPNVMPLGVFANEDDVYGWKKFNSGNAAANVPKLTFTYDGNCDQYKGLTVCGAIRTRWQQLGGASSYLGLPTSKYTATSGKPGYYNHFAGGSIFWSSATGAHDIRNGAMRDRYSALGWHTGYLGFPTNDMTAIPGGWYEHFQGGSMFWTSATGAKVVKAGPIRDKYQAMGWHTSLLGYPTTDEVAVAGGTYTNFQKGSIYYSADTGAHWIRGAIRDKWNGMGAQASLLGFPSSDETAVTGGAYNHFADGSIFYSAATGAHWLRGAIRDKYAAVGWQASSLGFPTTDEAVVMKTVETTVTAEDGTETTTSEEVATDGLVNEFTRGSIYWSPDSGAHTLQGEIWRHWSEMTGRATWWGLPTSDEFPIPSGSRQDFQLGQLLLEDGNPEPRECTITGTSAADVLTGTAETDMICGLAGDDTIVGLEGDDIISADDGDDTVDGGPGWDVIHGGPGNDSIQGGVDDDVLAGDTGNDVLVGNEGDDRLFGESGSDRLEGADGADFLAGSAGDDVLEGGEGDDQLSGDDGDDELAANGGADEVVGGEGHDTLDGGDGVDHLLGNDGDDALAGQSGDDRLVGGIGQDTLDGGFGDDQLDGGPSGDRINGGVDQDACVQADAATEIAACEHVHRNAPEDTLAALISDTAPVHADVDTPQRVGAELVVNVDGTTIEAGVDPESGISFTSASEAMEGQESEILIGLPNAAALSDAQLAADGTIVYSGDAVDVGVQMIDDSVRIATVISSPDAPTRYEYPISLPSGATIHLDESGIVEIHGADGALLGGLAPAWARDANGASVPTHYEVAGTVVTQVVDLSNPLIEFPVTADPYKGKMLTARAPVRGSDGRLYSMTGYCATCYKGKAKISISLTSWGKQVWNGSAGVYNILKYGYAELIDRWPHTTSKATIYQQYACHAAWGSIGATGPSWDMEAFRRDFPNYTYTVASHRCNWDGPAGSR